MTTVSKLTLGVFVALMLVFGVALVAGANHVDDGGVDRAWTNDMNQESFWESEFGGECTKFENHSGFIPAQYEAAVVKDGNMVRVYHPAPSPFTAIGAVNPANGKHFDPPHSWVMKCNIDEEEPSTTTTMDGSTTTTTLLDPTTTVEDPTTTTSQTSTTAPSTTTTDGESSTTTTLTGSSSVPTPPVSGSGERDELPFTGLPVYVWAGIGLTLIGVGGFIRRLGTR